MDFLNFIWTHGVSFIFILSVIVFIHEMGHYLIARYNGVRVEVFSIGFGPEITGWTARSGTRWKISVLPLGGYVKMFGDVGVASTPSGETRDMSPEEQEISFFHKPVGQRIAIVFGGPFANFLLAIVILAVLFMTVGQRITPPDISMVKPGSPAEAVGLQPGDVIRKIDGQEIDRFETMQQIVRENPGVPLELTFLRYGTDEITVIVTPRMVTTTDRFGNSVRYGELGVGRKGVKFVQHDPLPAIWAATEETAALTALTLRAVGQMITGTRGTDELGGPIRIAQLSGQVAEEGAVTLFWFMAVLSINLGLINLFPIPMLDGGHLLFYVFEFVHGKPMGERAQEYGFRIGLALVVTLMVFATWNDLVNLDVFDFLVRKFS